MKRISSAFNSFKLKAIFISCVVYGFSANARAVTGKWKITGAKETVTDKESGKTHDLTAQLGDITEMIEQIIEFHSDGTYSTSNTLIGSKTGMQSTGTYNVSGKEIKLQQVKTNVPEVDKKYSSGTMNSKLPNTMTIVSQRGNTLVLHYSAEITDKGKPLLWISRTYLQSNKMGGGE